MDGEERRLMHLYLGNLCHGLVNGHTREVFYQSPVRTDTMVKGKWKRKSVLTGGEKTSIASLRFLLYLYPFSLPWASSSRITDSVLAHGKGKGKRRENEKRPVPEDAYERSLLLGLL